MIIRDKRGSSSGLHEEDLPAVKAAALRLRYFKLCQSNQNKARENTSVMSFISNTEEAGLILYSVMF